MPTAEGFCHCNECRTWSAAPFVAFSLWATDAVKITSGEANLLVGNPAKAAAHLGTLKDICGNYSETMKLRKALTRYKRTAQSSMLLSDGEGS